jgi:hypothetical protein
MGTCPRPTPYLYKLSLCGFIHWLLTALSSSALEN